MEFLVIIKSANPAKVSKLNAGSVEEAITKLSAEAISDFDLYLNIRDNNFSDITQRLELLEESFLSLQPLLQTNTDANKVMRPLTPPSVDNLENREKPKSKFIKVGLIDKKLSKASPQLGRYEDKMYFSIKINNLTENPIRAIKGDIVFSDLFDADIFRVSVTINQKISPQGNTKWDGEMTHNQFIPTHVHFAGFSKEDLKVRFENENVVFV